MSWLGDPQAAAPLLWLTVVLFTARVVGQVVVVLFRPRWLPAMEQWQSGLLPYPALLASQVVIIALMSTISVQFWAGDGWSVEPRAPRVGVVVFALSLVYWAGMVARYVLSMARHPERRWFGRTIPIVFHCVLALFLFVVGTYHAFAG